MSGKQYLTYEDAARLFRISKGTLSKWTKKGLLYPINSIDVITRKRVKFVRKNDVRFLYRLFSGLPTTRRNSHYLMPLFRQAVSRDHRRRCGRN